MSKRFTEPLKSALREKFRLLGSGQNHMARAIARPSDFQKGVVDCLQCSRRPASILSNGG